MSDPRSGTTVALFCGSRDWLNRRPIQLDIESLSEVAVVLEGGARGAGRIAREEALARGLVDCLVAMVGGMEFEFGKDAGFTLKMVKPDDGMFPNA